MWRTCSGPASCSRGDPRTSEDANATSARHGVAVGFRREVDPRGICLVPARGLRSAYARHVECDVGCRRPIFRRDSPARFLAGQPKPEAFRTRTASAIERGSSGSITGAPITGTSWTLILGRPSQRPAGPPTVGQRFLLTILPKRFSRRDVNVMRFRERVSGNAPAMAGQGAFLDAASVVQQPNAAQAEVARPGRSAWQRASVAPNHPCFQRSVSNCPRTHGEIGLGSHQRNKNWEKPTRS